MDASLQDAEKNFGDMETRDAHMTKAEYLAQIGDKVSKFVHVLYEQELRLHLPLLVVLLL